MISPSKNLGFGDCASLADDCTVPHSVGCYDRASGCDPRRVADRLVAGLQKGVTLLFEVARCCKHLFDAPSVKWLPDYRKLEMKYVCVCGAEFFSRATF